MKFTSELTKRGIVFFLFGVLSFSSIAYAQSASLSLASGPAPQGGSVSLDLTLAGSGSPAGLQWTLSYASKDVASVGAVAGTALTSAGKTLSCTSGTGSMTCLATGMNATGIGNGVIASVSVKLTSTASASVSLPMSNVLGAGGDGMPASVSGTGSTITIAQPQTNPLGILTAYAFSEGSGSTTADSSGNGATGSILGATWTANGKYGSAVSFNGSNSYVDLGSPASLQTTGSMTWSAWVNAAANPPDDGQIVAQSDDVSGWQLKTSPDTGTRTFGVAVSSNGTHAQRYSKTVLALNSWYHVAGVYNAAAQTLDIYVNGVLDNGVLTGTVPSSQALAAVNATIGRRAGGYYFNGTIDNVRVYNRALSASEIQSDMISPADGSGTAQRAVTLQSLQCSPATVVSGGNSTCTVTLSAAATVSSAVAISDNSAALTVPASVTVAAGSTTASFTAAAGSVTSNQPVTITGSLNGVSATASLTITPPAATVSLLQCSPSTVTSGGTSTCTVTLSAAASASTSVAVSDNNAALTVPPSVTVAAGSTTANFAAVAGSVTTSQAATITASLNGGSAAASLTITPPALAVSQLQCSPSTVPSSGASTCTVTLSAAPAASTSVVVSDDSTALTVPASVSIPAGSATATFTATASSVTTSQAVTVTAALNGSSAKSSLTVQPATILASAAYAFEEGSGTATTDGSGNGATGVIQGATWTTNGKYGNALWFNGSNSYVDLGTPASLQTTGSMTWSAWVNATGNPPDDGQIVAQSDDVSGWQFKTSPDTGARTFAVAVNSNGAHTQRYSKTVLTLNTWYHVAGVYNATAQTLDIYVNGVLDNGVLTGTVPTSQALAAINATIGQRAGGYYFNGTIDNVRIYNRALSASEIQTDMNTPADGSSALPQPGATLQSLQCSPNTVLSGGSSTCTVTLSAAASTSSAVAISDNSTALTVPASVTVAAGSTTASFTATAGSVTSDQSVTITASLNGSSATAPLTIRPAVISLSAAYPFAEGSGTTTADVSGNGATGQIVKASWTTSGKHGSALSFNGSNGYVDLGSPASLQNTGSMTWSAWVNVSGNPRDDGQIIARSDDGSGWQLKITPDTGQRTFGVAISGSAGSHTQRYSKTVYSSNTWYFVAGVYNASAQTLDIYVNGVLDNGALVGTVPAWQYVPAVNTMIGRRSGGYYFKGVIDDVRVYSRALTQAEIQSDMNAGVTASGQ